MSESKTLLNKAFRNRSNARKSDFPKKIMIYREEWSRFHRICPRKPSTIMLLWRIQKTTLCQSYTLFFNLKEESNEQIK